MENTLKISVVIPIYKVEEYIVECIESVLKQDYPFIEIVLVNDGSPDNSPSICENYANRFSKIKVIHKENGGLSDARNKGVECATGDYIMFLDGDDYWDDSHAVSKLVDRLKESKVEVLNYSYKKCFGDKKIPLFENIDEMPLIYKTKKAQLEFLTKNHLYIASACNKLIAKSLFTKDLQFKKGVCSEDIEWCARLLKYAKSLDFICLDFYCYRQREYSIAHTMDLKKCNDLKDNIISSILIANEITNEEQEDFYRYAAYQFATFVKNQTFLDVAPRECIESLSKYKWILKYYGNSKKVKMLYLGTKLLGFKGLCWLIRVICKWGIV